MASETVDPIDWSHLPPSGAVPPEHLVHSINRCSSATAGIRSCNLAAINMGGNHLAYVATQGILSFINIFFSFFFLLELERVIIIIVIVMNHVTFYLSPSDSLTKYIGEHYLSLWRTHCGEITCREDTLSQKNSNIRPQLTSSSPEAAIYKT